jgi:lambda family phage portal protein
VTLFASVLNRYGDIKEIDEAERVAAKVAASMAAYIKKATPDMYEAAVDEMGQPRARNMEFMAGIVFDDLQPGEEIGTIDTRRPNNALIPFRDSQLRAAAAGTKVSFSSSSKNYNGTYSAQRQELVEQWGMYQGLGSSFVYRVAQPVWDGFIDAVVASGAIEIPRNVDRETLYDCVHTGPSMVWIDPVKETEAQVMQLKWALKARSRIIRERGDNPDQVNREIERDRKERERLGIEFLDLQQADPQPEREDDPDEGNPGQGENENGASNA